MSAATVPASDGQSQGESYTVCVLIYASLCMCKVMVVQGSVVAFCTDACIRTVCVRPSVFIL